MFICSWDWITKVSFFESLQTSAKLHLLYSAPTQCPRQTWYLEFVLSKPTSFYTSSGPSPSIRKIISTYQHVDIVCSAYATFSSSATCLTCTSLRACKFNLTFSIENLYISILSLYSNTLLPLQHAVADNGYKLTYLCAIRCAHMVKPLNLVLQGLLCGIVETFCLVVAWSWNPQSYRPWDSTR